MLLTHHVFVYGTLRGGGSNSYRMDGSLFLSPATIRGRLYHIEWYPGLVCDPAADLIHGEIYQLGDELLTALDEFEQCNPPAGEPILYRRVQVPAELPDGAQLLVWVWEWLGPVEESRRVHSGDWLAFFA
ncbi:MAG: gamma-glutamylcyclotransferase [Verrucomicrobia bacterium]|nr:MAG: gamma-glutamylcyclotransferase [Verrucomicrobiota bacterium]